MLLDSNMLPVLANRSKTTFFVEDGEALRQADDEEVLCEAQRIVAARLYRDRLIATSVSMIGYWRHYFSTMGDREVFAVAMFDSQQQLIGTYNVASGTIDKCHVHSRELIKLVLREGAFAVCLAHQHPSGIPDASLDDKFLTKSIVEALRLIDVRVTDHVIIGGNSYTSFAECGWL